HQLHLPAGDPQRLRGTIALILPDLNALRQRLSEVEALLQQTEFSVSDRGGVVEVTCPWGNRFRCYQPSAEFGAIELGIAYVEFNVAPGTASGIAAFYRDIMGARTSTGSLDGAVTASVRAGRDQRLLFRETVAPLEPYDGHHIQIYIADFSGP